MIPERKPTTGENLAERLKQAEEALQARELNFQLIVDSIPAQVAVITPTGEVETLNQPCLEYFGKTLDELKGWASSDPVHPEDLPHVNEVLKHALETGAKRRRPPLSWIPNVSLIHTNKFSIFTGSSRTRTPVAWWTAAVIAAATPAKPISPIPRAPSSLISLSG